jgi:hypothetical protein
VVPFGGLVDENPTYQEVAVNCVPLRFVNTAPLPMGYDRRATSHGRAFPVNLKVWQKGLT